MRPGFYFCICPDPEIIKDFIEDEIKKLKGLWEKRIIWADDENLHKKFFELFNTSSIIGKKTVVIIRQAHTLPKDFFEKLSRFLNRFHNDLFPFICIESEWKRGKPSIPTHISSKKYYKFAEKRGWIFAHSGVSDEFLSNYLKNWAKEHNIIIPQEIFFLLKEILPKDLAGIKSELKKLKLSCTDKKITQDDLKVIWPSLDFNVFDLINSIEGIKSPKLIWDAILQNKFDTYEDVIPMLHLILREGRILWQLLNGETVNLPVKTKQEKTIVARRLGKGKIIEVFNIVCDADLKLKTTNLTPSEIFQQAVTKLQNIFLING